MAESSIYLRVVRSLEEAGIGDGAVVVGRNAVGSDSSVGPAELSAVCRSVHRCYSTHIMQ